jgi:hypothetical protein
MGRVFVDIGMSLDGFVAGPSARPGNPLGDGGTRIHEWMFPLASFQARSGGTGGEENADDTVLKRFFGLFENLAGLDVKLEPGPAQASPRVTHLSFRVARESGSGARDA